jgi:hypothetical protein
MKKVILILCLTMGFSQFSNAQIAFGIKGGVNYNSNSIKEVRTDFFEDSKSKTGYHAGIWVRAKLPILGWYIRPELVYTNLENEVLFKTTGNTTYNFQKMDIPVLLGKKIFGVGNIFIGPSFQYILNADFSLNDISGVKTDNFTVGLQFGGGIELGKFGIDVRWERGFNGIESTFLNGASNVDFDTRINQIILGLSIKL